jgi:hypothetical protein
MSRVARRLAILAALAALAVAACERGRVAADTAAGRPGEPAGESTDSLAFTLSDTMPTLTADTLTTVRLDSTGLAGVPMCASLQAVRRVFPQAVGIMTYCPEDGCDAAYPAAVALTRAGDTLLYESQIPISGEPQDSHPLVRYAYTTSPRVRTPLGAHVGMTVGAVLALGETVEPDTSAVVVAVTPLDDATADTLREGPRVLRLYLRTQGLVAEVRDSVGRDFTRHLAPGRSARDALDTAARIGAVGVVRDVCR